MTKPDPRKVKVAITMTAEEWDSIAGDRNSTYASDLHHRAQQKIQDAIGPAAPRQAVARAEFEATIPKLTRSTKLKLGGQTRALLRKHAHHDLHVNHLGYGDDTPPDVDGFSVTIIPHTANGGWPALHFSMRDLYFERAVAELEAADIAWFTRLVGRYRAVQSVWGGGNYLSVAFLP